METPTLNFDVISKILNIRMNQKRTDRIEAHKKIYGPVVKNINNIFEEGSPHNSNDDSPWLQYIFELIYMENQTVQRPYMPWEKEWSGN